MAVINTNIASLNAQNNLSASQTALNTSLERLSSGLRINSAKDDAAGLAISERFTTQINGNDQAARNANDAISLSQTAEGAMDEITNNLQRIRELSVQSLNATNSASDREALDNEVQQLISEIDRVAEQTAFNGVNLLDGSFTDQVFQVGANVGETITIDSISSMKAEDLFGAGTVVPGTPEVPAADAEVTSIATTAALTAGDLTINGTDVGTSDSASAADIAQAINGAAITGVTATATSPTDVTGSAPAGVGAITASAFTINGEDIGAITAGSDAAEQGANVAAAINDLTSTTGVSANADATTGAITLSAANGADINISGTLDNTGLTAGEHHGTVSITSADDIVIAGADPSKAGLTAGTTTATEAVAATPDSTVSAVSVLTVDSSNAALTAIDSALNTLNAERGSMGAYQNRFESVVTNLQTTSENLTASRSRIQDADFASETAELTRSQILQQAGTAMLAQANSLPNTVLSLLQ